MRASGIGTGQQKKEIWPTQNLPIQPLYRQNSIKFK